MAKELTADLVKNAQAVKSAAEAAAPGGGTGGYRRRFVVVEDDGKVSVGNTDIAAHLIEWGSSKNPPHAPLRRGVEAAGLQLQGEEKQ